VTGEAADDLVGRIVDGCEFRTKLRKRRGLDLPDEVGEHVVEKANLFGVEIACVAEKRSVMRLRISVRRSLEPAARTYSSSSMTDAACDISCLGQDSSRRLSLTGAGRPRRAAAP
jgi:hypothetical protein